MTKDTTEKTNLGGKLATGTATLTFLVRSRPHSDVFAIPGRVGLKLERGQLSRAAHLDGSAEPAVAEAGHPHQVVVVVVFSLCFTSRA